MMEDTLADRPLCAVQCASCVRIHHDYNSIVDAARTAWNRFKAATGRIKSLCSFSWILRVGTYG